MSTSKPFQGKPTNQLKLSAMVQTTLKVWFCLETVQELIDTRDGLGHKP